MALWLWERRRPPLWARWGDLFTLISHTPEVQASHGDHASAETYAAKAHRFETFFLRYDRQVAGYLWRMIGDEQIVCDLSQETFLRAWRHFDQISTYDLPGAWLFRVATNLALHHLQHHFTRQPILSLDLVDDPAASDPASHFGERDQVRQTLMALSPRLRAVLILREVYGLSCDETATALGMTHDATKMAFWRAREQFRAIYLRQEQPR